MTVLLQDIRDQLEALLVKVETALAVEAKEPAHVEKRLTVSDVNAAGASIEVAAAKIWAFKDVESGRDSGFGDDGRPLILFEPHVFSKLTDHRYDKTHGGVSYPKWDAKRYPAEQDDRWAQLEYAARLDHDAAYQSASYGLFQVMGFNWKLCGYASLQAFLDAMHRSERDHLEACIGYLKGKGLVSALKAGDWLTLAAGYNGTGQAPVYAAKLAKAYAKRIAA